MGNNNKLMSMAAFCKLRDIPRLTFLRRCKSDATKEAEKKQRRECYAAMSDETKGAEKKQKRERYATMSDETKEAEKKRMRETSAKRHAVKSDETKEAEKKQKRECYACASVYLVHSNLPLLPLYASIRKLDHYLHRGPCNHLIIYQRHIASDRL